MLRIPAIALGFIYFWEWEQFLEKHEKDFSWEPGGRLYAKAMSMMNIRNGFLGKRDMIPGRCRT